MECIVYALEMPGKIISKSAPAAAKEQERKAFQLCICFFFSCWLHDGRFPLLLR